MSISILGFGQVGKAISYLLSQQISGTTINIVDPYPNLGSFEDMSHAHQLAKNELRLNPSDALQASEVIFHCAGPSVPPGADRLSVTEASLALTDSIFKGIEFENPNTLIVVVANPLDLVCRQTWLSSGLPPSQILGTGTLLDTIRFNNILERDLNLQRGESKVVLLGEHGNSMCLWPSGSLIRDESPLQMMSLDRLEEFLERTKKAAGFIKKHQGATYYGVANCAIQLWRDYFSKERTLLPVSTLVQPEFISDFGGEAFYMSLPSLVGCNQVIPQFDEFSELEMEDLKRSARKLHEAWPAP